MADQWNGKIVFASGKTGDYDIWTFDFETGEMKQLTFGQFWNDRPRWSPDGNWVVFVSNRTGYQDIFKVPANGGDVIQLTDFQRWTDSPSFSPDGSSIVFMSNESGNNDIWIMDADGSNRYQITTHEGSDEHVEWTPDGKGLLWSSDRDNGDADIWHMDIATETKTQLTTEFGADISPSPSPDGKLIAFVSNRQFKSDPDRPFKDRDKDVWLMKADGSWPVRLTDNQGCDFCPCWSPDGRYLMYTSATDRTACHLRVIDLTAVNEAFAGSDQQAVEKAAKAIRTEPIDLDRDPLKAEIDARRYTTFVTSWMPEKWIAGLYPTEYFGLERSPHWVGSSRSSFPNTQLDATSVNYAPQSTDPA